MDVVATWTGRQARALRSAWRLTIEEFAEKLGVATRTVAKWEADPSFVPALAMQQVLDAALEQVPAPVRARLSLLLTEPNPDQVRLHDGDADDVGWAIGAMQAFRMADLSLDPPTNYGGSFPARSLHAEFRRVSPGMVAWPRALAAARA